MTVRIALDAMGGDHAPRVPVEGALRALREIPDLHILLVGPEDRLRATLGRHAAGLPLSIVHASQVVEMHEHTIAVKAKRDSSMVVGMRLVRAGEADAFVSMGNTGAVMAAALFHLGRIPGIDRPALATLYPTLRGHCLLLDIGANTDPKPEHLVQFAMMGVVYAERVLGWPRPRVGILSNGEEPGKGSILVREAYRRLEASGLNFIGNVEGKDIPRGAADVVVTDGFTGNVVVKHTEGFVAFLVRFLKAQLTDGALDRAGLAMALPGLLLAAPGLLLLLPSLRAILRRLDYREYGGAPLLGVDGVVVIGHGRSDAKAVKTRSTLPSGLCVAGCWPPSGKASPPSRLPPRWKQPSAERKAVGLSSMAVVSVIATVKNEVASIQELLDSLAAQSHPPDEVVIADGGSTDGTLERLRAERRLPLRVIEAPGANIAQGRNRAIAAARGEIIAVTDAGVRLHPDWLRHLLRPFRERPETMVAAGFFLPDPRTPFEVAMAATVLPELRDIRPERFWPSSRSVAFRKSAWEAVGGYPEWLDYCEDLIFDFALYERFGPFAFVPEAVVYFRPRPTLRAFFLQYYRYARGDGKADLWRLRHAIRYGTYLGLVPLLAGLSLGVHPVFALGYLLGGALYLRTPYRRLFRLWEGYPWEDRIRMLGWVPLIRVWGDIAKMCGYPVGVWWRWRHRRGLRRLRGSTGLSR
jgi:fatty acid/phospholipid synthesis protein PlsX